VPFVQSGGALEKTTNLLLICTRSSMTLSPAQRSMRSLRPQGYFIKTHVVLERQMNGRTFLASIVLVVNNSRRSPLLKF
jgi:hypothetical protein